MIIEISGQQIEVDDSFAKLNPEQQNAEVDYIQKQILSSQQPKVDAKQAELTNPLYGIVGGGIAGTTMGPAISAGAKEFERNRIAKAQGVNPSEVILQKTAEGTDRWSLSSGKSLGDSPHILDRANAYKAAEEELNTLKARQNAPIGGAAKHGTRATTLSPEDVKRIAELEHKIGPGRIEELAQMTKKNMSAGEKLAQAIGIPTGVQTAVKGANAALQRGVYPWLGRGIAGAGAGYEAVDAYNRLKTGDYGGALIGGLGMLGGLATLAPHPIARYGGLAVGIGANKLNEYLDSLKNKPAMAEGGQVKPRSKAHAAAMHLMSYKK